MIIKMQHSEKVTNKERRFLKAYVWAKKTYCRKPSFSEMARILGYRSANSIKQFVLSLHRKGVDLDKYQTKRLIKSELKSTILIPVVGSAPCGTPFLAQENWEDEIPVDATLLRSNPKEYFFLKAKGDSMNLAGIENEDYVLFHSQPTAQVGERVVALLGDEATIKIFKSGNGYIALLPKSSDSSFKPIIVSEDIKIQGVVKLVIKNKTMKGGEDL